MFASCTTLRHISISAPDGLAELLRGAARRRHAVVLQAAPRFLELERLGAAALILLTISGGIPLGPMSPCQRVTS
jgi:hypothetical protein